MNLHVSLQRTTDELLSQPNVRLRIGEHVVDVGALRVVTRPGHARLTSKAMAVLIELVRGAGTTLTRDQLLDRVWKGRCPTPDVLTQAIKELRRAFADDSRPPRYIETIPKVGYRLLAQVLVLEGPEGRVFLDDSADDPVAGDSVSPGTGAPVRDRPALPPPRPRPSRAAWAVLAALAAVATLAFAMLAADRRAPRAGAQLWRAADVGVLTSDPGPERRPHISPDGTRVAFAVADAHSRLDRIVVRSLAPSQRVHLTLGTNHHEASPVWSPDGTRIAFERLGAPGCTMYIAPGLGGSESEVGTCRDYNVNYYDWTPDGRALITAQRRDDGQGPLELVQWDLDSGGKRFLDYQRGPDDDDLEARYSPDGRWIAFRRGVAPYSDLFVMAAAGGAVRQATHVAARIRGYAWASDSRTLVLATNFAGTYALYAADSVTGDLQPLGVSPAEYPDVARSGDRVVYEIPRTRSSVRFVPFGAGPAQELAPSTGSDFSAELAPAGDRVVFVSDRGGQAQLWLAGRSGGMASPLTDDPGSAVFLPHWSADGRRIVAVRYRAADGRRLVEIDLATRRLRVLSRAGENVMFGTFGVDPDTFVLAIGTSGHDNRLVLLEQPATSRERRVVLANGVAWAEIDASTRSVYYTMPGRGLFRRSLGDGDAQFVTPKVDAVTMNGWRIVDGRIWYESGLGVSPAVLREIDPATGAEREVARLDVALEETGFSVTAQRDGVIVTPIGSEDTDVGTFRLMRRSAGE